MQFLFFSLFPFPMKSLNSPWKRNKKTKGKYEERFKMWAFIRVSRTNRLNDAAKLDC